MKLQKRIPARTKTVTANWLQREFLPMSKEFRAARSRSRNKMDSCFWCRRTFQLGEMMALANFKELRGNKVLCQQCAAVLANDN